LVKSIFDEVTTFADSTFYDISTWTFPYAFNLQFDKLSSLKGLEKENKAPTKEIQGKVIGGESHLAYLFKWDEFTSAKALYQLQKHGLFTKVASEKFSFQIEEKEEEFSYGTILIPVSGQKLKQKEIFNLISKTAKETGIDFYSLNTGLSPKGIDLGSSSFAALKKPEILILVGGSTSSSDAGEIWHLFDQRYNIPVTLMETSQLRTADLSKYNSIILPGGSYKEFNSTDVQTLKVWANKGGKIIAYKSATEWAAKNKFGKAIFKKANAQDSTLKLTYVDRRKESSLKTISGAIFNAEIDITHPLCFGYSSNELPVFKSGNSVANSLKVNYAEPVKFTSNPYLSGFVSDKNLDRIKNAPIVSIQSLGKGKLISYHDNMVFRGIWLGTNKLFSNSVFFGSMIR
jgi:hypothetical protein